jgi:cold shock CspA family protein
LRPKVEITAISFYRCIVSPNSPTHSERKGATHSEGVLTHWQADRGFGFIQPIEGGDHVFVHIRAFKSLSGGPSLNQRVLFQVKTTDQGKRRAVNVLVCGPHERHRNRPIGTIRTQVTKGAAVATLGLLLTGYWLSAAWLSNF